MIALRQSLKNCGYQGDCENEEILTWAIRTGSCSQFFTELITWLENQLQTARVTTLVRANIRNLFSQMRSSILMRPHVATAETVLNPKEYRLQTLKVLAHQLELVRRTDRNSYDDVEESLVGDKDARINVPSDIRVTLNNQKPMFDGKWSERLVRYNPNLLKMYE